MKMRPIRRPSMNRAFSAPAGLGQRDGPSGASAGCTRTETPLGRVRRWATSLMR